MRLDLFGDILRIKIPGLLLCELAALEQLGECFHPPHVSSSMKASQPGSTSDHCCIQTSILPTLGVDSWCPFIHLSIQQGFVEHHFIKSQLKKNQWSWEWYWSALSRHSDLGKRGNRSAHWFQGSESCHLHSCWLPLCVKHWQGIKIKKTSISKLQMRTN